MPESFTELTALEDGGRSDQPASTSLISESQRSNGIADNRARIFAALFFFLFVAIGVVVYIAHHLSKTECHMNLCSEVVQPKDGRCSRASCKECMANSKASHDGIVTYCAPICDIELCDEVSVPRGVNECSDDKVACAKCAMWKGEQTAAKQDSEGKYCGLICAIDHCKTVKVPRGKVENCSSTGVTCEEANGGYVPMRDENGAYAGLKCELKNCASYKMKREATDCKDAECTACSKGSQFSVDDKWNLEPTCINRCTDDQIRAGCAAFSCSSASSCSKCAPGFTSTGTACEKAGGPTLMEFYMYRAAKEMATDYVLENIDTASAAGVLWYIHNEVVRVSCLPPSMERHYGITRIQRFKVKVKNTEQVYARSGGPHLLGRFTQFDSGKCTIPNCDAVWDDFGYHVGVQMTTFKPGTMGFPYYENRYSNALWYSLPGSCPEKEWNDPGKKECAKNRPGGACRNEAGDSLPTGTSTCTWQIDGDIREVTLDELTGITDYKAFCAAGNKEYDTATDHGVGLSWWDHREDDEANAERTRLLLAKFAEKYPEDPVFLDPIFDGF